MKESQLKELYVEELRDLYSAENQLLKAIPKMAKAATSSDLRAGFEKHLEQTKGHVERLEEIFQALGESPKGKTCKGMQGLIAEGGEMIQEKSGEKEALDAGLISAAQRVEHYEIAGYGCVVAYADLLGEDEAASLLRATLDEEKTTDEKLTELARKINVQAAETTSGEEAGRSSGEKRHAAKSRSARA